VKDVEETTPSKTVAAVAEGVCSEFSQCSGPP